MKKIITIIIMLMAVQVNADAQFWKNLGKALEEVAKTVVEGSSESNSSKSSGNSSMSAEQAAKQTGLSVELTSAIRADNYGFLTFTLKNNTSEDRSVALSTYYYLDGAKSLLLPDGTALEYEMKWGGKWQDNLLPEKLNLPAGIPVKVFVLTNLRNDFVTSLGRFRLILDGKYNYDFKNLELTPANNSDSEKMTVNSKDVKVDFVSCVREGKNLAIKIKVTPKEDLSMQFSEHTTGNSLYDAEGNIYKNIQAKVGNGLEAYNYEAGVPINGTIVVYDVPANQNKFSRLQYVFEANGDYYPYTIKIKDFVAETAQTALNSSEAKKQEATKLVGKGDLAAFDLRGNVKQVTTTEDGKQMVRTFDTNGKWITCNGQTLAKYYPAGIKRDTKGRIIEGHPDLTEPDFVHNYKYNAKGQLETLILNQDYYTRVLSYTYDGAGNITQVREPIEPEPGNEDATPGEVVVKYVITAKDSQGNWTERKANGTTERRKIVYY